MSRTLAEWLQSHRRPLVSWAFGVAGGGVIAAIVALANSDSFLLSARAESVERVVIPSAALVPLVAFLFLGALLPLSIPAKTQDPAEETRRWGLAAVLYATSLTLGGFFGYIFAMATRDWHHLVFFGIASLILYSLVITVGREIRYAAENAERRPGAIPWWDGLLLIAVVVYASVFGFLMFGRFALKERNAGNPSYTPPGVTAKVPSDPGAAK